MAVATGGYEDDTSLRNTLLILIWAFFTLIWSIFTQPHKTFPARTFIFQPAWALRIYQQDSTWLQDLFLFLCLHSVFTYCNGSWRFLSPRDFRWLDLRDPVIHLYIKTFGLLGGCGAFAGGIVYRGHHLKKVAERREQLAEQRIDEQLLPPLLIPSRTAHSRTFPQRHAFTYTYLFVGVPVGVKGPVGKALSIDGRNRSWFHVSASDYLFRSGRKLDLADKLKSYLHTQGVTDRDYAFAYLVTAPRFLGYSFNPVSFWYLYDADTVLKYMILEVNNTFDERRMYLLGTDGSAEGANGSSGGKKSNGKTFTDTWEKDFHVSPFNSRQGSYSLRALDPLAAYEETGHVRIDNKIVLRSSKESPKIVAHVWSEGEPKEAANIGTLELSRFIASWWWVGLATFPRIVWEAQKLFLRRKLNVWFRPEVADSSIGRTYTDDERQLEGFFQVFLRHAVESSTDALQVIYHPAHSDGQEEIAMYSPGFIYEEDHKRKLTLRVSSPAFYSRFVHYAHVQEAFDRESLSTDEKNRTLIIENQALLPTLLKAIQTAQQQNAKLPTPTTLIDRPRWSILKALRCPPSNPSYPNPATTTTISDIRTLPQSPLDTYIQQHQPAPEAGTYRRIATKLFLAQRFAFGIPALVTALDWLVRSALIILALYYADKWREVDLLRPREVARLREWSWGEDGWRMGVLGGLTSAVHVWTWVKG